MDKENSICIVRMFDHLSKVVVMCFITMHNKTEKGYC